MTKKDRQASTKLDAEERQMLRSYEEGEWEPVAESDDEIARYQEYAAATFKKDRRINLRISSRDLKKLQMRALEEGIPYQTLAASVLHKFVERRD